MKIHTETVHFSADSKLLRFTDKKISKLDQFFDKIIDANVIMKLENSGQIKDKIVEVRLTIPGSVLFVKECNKTFEASVDNAANTLKRQLIKYKERLRSKSGSRGM